MAQSRLRPFSSLLLRSCEPPSRSLTPFLTPILARNASHSTEGRANKAKQGPGKRLGAKKGASELVVPGNIIFRQRGTHWFPGENCDMGRDHTIFATQKGYVTYYKDPDKHPDRKYIGVVFERGMKLPVSPHAPRKRRLGLVGREMSTAAPTPVVQEVPEQDSAAEGTDTKKTFVALKTKKQKKEVVPPHQDMVMGHSYSYREANWSIGRAAERAGVKVREFDPRDRFMAWRKRAKRQREAREKRVTRRPTKKRRTTNKRK
ncbi:MAG: hypothetical protein Q9195_006865 [Heterodermia aff. obscurata]